MTILRRHLSTGFTVMPTAALEDSHLSFRARGILAFLLSKPDSWKVRSESIAAAGKEGREAVRTALKELREAGYYRVVTDRLDDGTIASITEVYDTAQDWAAEEYVRQVGRRVARRLERETGPEAGGAGGESVTGDGFSGAGFPDVGSPDAGPSGLLVSNQNQYSKKKTPPPPTADAAGDPAPADDASPRRLPPGGVSSCPAHPDGAGRRCRSCGTTPRQLRAEEQRAEKERFKAARDAANERVLAEVRRKPGSEELSTVAQRRIAEMRSMTGRSSVPDGRGRRTPRNPK
ncbi:hypothetical protein AB0G73_14225 [Streptomyces sp. NPDC020719]|uniref:hypothetical protein n=1 Tax=Streptomyces sp. NPDC020719 TaxID=3154896 RepID=UPI0033FD30ED